MDGGAGLLEVVDGLAGPVRVLCDVTTTLYDAPRRFGPQKGATPEQVEELDQLLRRFAERCDKMTEANTPGAGAAGGLGFAMLAFFNATLRPGTYIPGMVIGPDFKSVNLTVAKNFAVTSRTRLQVRLDAFNLFNNKNLAQPTAGITASNFGVITSVVAVNTPGYPRTAQVGFDRRVGVPRRGHQVAFARMTMRVNDHKPDSILLLLLQLLLSGWREVVAELRWPPETRSKS